MTTATAEQNAAFINAAQATCMTLYDGGKFAYLLGFGSEREFNRGLADCGDRLLQFLLVDLSTNEFCISTASAVSRIRLTMKCLDELLHGLECQPNQNETFAIPIETRLYRKMWIDGYGERNGKSEVAELSHYLRDRGFDQAQKTVISSLHVGQSHLFSCPECSLNVIRVQ